MTWLGNLTDRGMSPALETTLQFQQARLRMIAENVANAQTPGYRAKQLDVAGFQRSLREAISARDADPGKSFAVRSGREVRTTSNGKLAVSPSLKPVESALLHDGTNVSIERQMSDLAETGIAYDLSVQLLKGNYDRLRKAIRGTV